MSESSEKEHVVKEPFTPSTWVSSCFKVVELLLVSSCLRVVELLLFSSSFKVVELPLISSPLKVVELPDLSSNAATASMIAIAEVFAHSPLVPLELVIENQVGTST